VDVLIVGAGVGGLALAGALVDDGHQVRVLEAAPGLREGGAAVTIYSNGAAALARLGAPLPDDIGGTIDHLEIRSATGAVTMRTDMRVMHRKTGFPVVTVPRHELIEHLAARLPGGVIRFDTAVTEVDGDGTVIDRRGEKHTSQVLVGADGQRSAVRQGVLQDGPASDCGWTTWQGLTPVLPELAAGNTGVLLVGDAGLVGLMPAGHGLLQWWFDVEGARIDPAVESVTAWLRRRFGGFADPVPALLESISDSDVGCYPHVLHRIPNAWGVGATTLLGDAAHAFPPSQAQGANQALEDAWLLRRALAGDGDVVAALRSYERLRAVRVRRVSKMAASETTNKPPKTLARLAVKFMPASMTGAAYTSLIRRFSSVLADERP
jgi:FAD-dependent urate hydroxylase